jgi:hypothetical protein
VDDARRCRRYRAYRRRWVGSSPTPRCRCDGDGHQDHNADVPSILKTLTYPFSLFFPPSSFLSPFSIPPTPFSPLFLLYYSSSTSMKKSTTNWYISYQLVVYSPTITPWFLSPTTKIRILSGAPWCWEVIYQRRTDVTTYFFAVSIHEEPLALVGPY